VRLGAAGGPPGKIGIATPPRVGAYVRGVESPVTPVGDEVTRRGVSGHAPEATRSRGAAATHFPRALASSRRRLRTRRGASSLFANQTEFAAPWEASSDTSAALREWMATHLPSGLGESAPPAAEARLSATLHLARSPKEQRAAHSEWKPRQGHWHFRVAGQRFPQFPATEQREPPPQSFGLRLP
jgi:hypothetical protein